MRRIGARLSLILGMAVIAVLAIAACGDGDPTVPSQVGFPHAYTKAFVRQAIDYYDDNGRDKTVDFYNSMESVDGPWYVFIGAENDVVVAHATIPDLLGKLPDAVRGPDGYPTGRQNRRRRHRGWRLGGV